MSQLTQVIRFSDLPGEIRNMIWSVAEDHRTERIITIAAKNSGMRTLWPYVDGLWFTVSVSCGPTLLQVNRESRSQLLSRYVRPFSPILCFPPAPIGSTPAGILRKTAGISTNDVLINPGKDILYLKISGQIPGDPRVVESAFGQNLTEVTAELGNVAVEHQLDVQALLSGDKTFLPNLEHVYLIDSGMKPLMERKGCRIAGFSLTAPGVPERIDTNG